MARTVVRGDIMKTKNTGDFAPISRLQDNEIASLSIMCGVTLCCWGLNMGVHSYGVLEI